MAFTIDTLQHVDERFNLDWTSETDPEICLKYTELPESSKEFQIAQAHYEKLKSQNVLDNGEFLCLGKTIVVLLFDSNGNLLTIGDNSVSQPVSYCNKEVLDQSHYTSCAKICGQDLHAEGDALKKIFRAYEMISRDEEESISHEPIELLRTNPDNTPMIATRTAHESFLNLIKQKRLQLPEGTRVYMYGHIKCCKQCAALLYHSNVREVYVTPSSLAYQREERRAHHTSSEIKHNYIDKSEPYFEPKPLEG